MPPAVPAAPAAVGGQEAVAKNPKPGSLAFHTSVVGPNCTPGTPALYLGGDQRRSTKADGGTRVSAGQALASVCGQPD